MPLHIQGHTTKLNKLSKKDKQNKMEIEIKNLFKTDIGPVVQEDGGEEAGEGQAGQHAHGVRPEGVQPRQHRVHARTRLVGEKQLPEQ